MSLETLRGMFGPEVDVEDPEEETFVLFSQNIPSQNLGFIDSAAAVLELTVAGRDLTIHQSPTVLSSNRAGGTTGAVVWKITPLFAEWLASPGNVLFRAGLLGGSSAVLELGCGASAVVGLTLAPHVSRYVLTDQPYVARLVAQNIAENRHLLLPPQAGAGARPAPHHGKPSARSRSSKSSHAATDDPAPPQPADRLRFAPLDWEQDDVTTSAAAAAALTGSADVAAFDAVVACDCIYNEALIEPLVRTCADVCRLRQSSSSSSSSAAAAADGNDDDRSRPCVCVVAQQLRDPDVFETWARRFCRSFHVLRVPDDHLPEGLRPAAGFVVHVGILRH